MAQREGQPGPSSQKKDRQSVEQLRREVDEAAPFNTTRAQQRDHNRDAARGDWDRTGRHHDEEAGRGETPERRPEDAYKND